MSAAQHTSGTCKMGPASDPSAVVDQFCSVHGIEGLRVVDASIMPNVVRSNPNASTMMMGERAAAWGAGRTFPPREHYSPFVGAVREQPALRQSRATTG